MAVFEKVRAVWEHKCDGCGQPLDTDEDHLIMELNVRSVNLPSFGRITRHEVHNNACAIQLLTIGPVHFTEAGEIVGS